MKPKFIGTSSVMIKDDIIALFPILEKYQCYTEEFNPELPYNAFRIKTSDYEIIDIYYKDIQIHMKITEEKSVFSIRIKKTEDEWRVLDDKSRPVNETFEVYIWYRVPILDLRKIEGSEYTNGAWDYAVFKDCEELISLIEGVTTKSRFQKSYNKKDNE